MPKAVKQMVKKHKIALFLNNGTALKRIKKSESLTISMNPEEEEHNYIADEGPTTELAQYKPSIDQDLTMFKGEDDYEMIFPYFYEMKTGTDAHTECVIAFMQEEAEGGGYKAWRTDSVISVQDMNAVDKKLNFKVLFGGTIEKGTVTMVDGVPTFTESN